MLGWAIRVFIRLVGEGGFNLWPKAKSAPPLEEIKHFRAKYWRGVDRPDGELVRSILADDCVLDYNDWMTDPKTGIDHMPTTLPIAWSTQDHQSTQNYWKQWLRWFLHFRGVISSGLEWPFSYRPPMEILSTRAKLAALAPPSIQWLNNSAPPG